MKNDMIRKGEKSDCNLCKIRKIISPILLLVMGIIFLSLLYIQTAYNYMPINFLSTTHPIQLSSTPTTSVNFLNPHLNFSEFEITPNDREIKINFYENELSRGFKNLKFNLPQGYIVTNYVPSYIPFFESLRSGKEDYFQRIISIRFPRHNQKDTVSSSLAFSLTQSKDPVILSNCATSTSSSLYILDANHESHTRNIGGTTFKKSIDIEGGMGNTEVFTSYFTLINDICYELDTEYGYEKYGEQNGLKPPYDFKWEIENLLNSFKFEKFYD